MTDKQWYAMLDVHTTAPFRILREASQFIREAVRERLTQIERLSEEKREKEIFRRNRQRRDALTVSDRRTAAPASGTAPA